MTYAITGLKTFRSPDGGGFNANLTVDGKKIADVHDGGHGGSLVFSFVDRYPVPTVPSQIRHYSTGEPIDVMASPEEAKLNAHVFAMPAEKCEYADSGERFPDVESFVNALVSAEEGRKRLVKTLAKGTVVVVGKVMYDLRLKGTMTPERHAQLKAESIARLAKKHPGETPIDLSALPFDEALPLYLAAGG